MEFYAPLVSAIIWIICYVLSSYCFSYTFSNKKIPRKLREKTNFKTIIYIFLGTLFIAPIISGLLYLLGGIIEKGRDIPWGARIDNFIDISLFLWLLSFLFLFLLLMITFIKPKIFGFEKRYKALLFYISHHMYTLILMVLFLMAILLIASPFLTRLNSTSSRWWG